MLKGDVQYLGYLISGLGIYPFLAILPNEKHHVFLRRSIASVNISISSVVLVLMILTANAPASGANERRSREAVALHALVRRKFHDLIVFQRHGRLSQTFPAFVLPPPKVGVWTRYLSGPLFL